MRYCWMWLLYQIYSSEYSSSPLVNKQRNLRRKLVTGKQISPTKFASTFKPHPFNSPLLFKRRGDRGEVVTIILILLFFQLTTNIFSQKDSSTHQSISNHHTNKKLFHFEKWSAPKKASVLSAIIPGAGQVYNKKYWKVPIIYGLGGWLVFNTIKQNQNYLYYKNELLKVLNGGINADGLSAQQLTLLKNQSKKWRDLSIAGIALVYVVNIIDANVDAHLKAFDISDNLSLQIYPDIKNFGTITDSYYSYQVTLRLKWK